MTSGSRLLALFAVTGAPLAWVAQLVLGYAFEESACSPGDGAAVWGMGVRELHAAVGVITCAVAVASLLAALALRSAKAITAALDPADRRFLGSFAEAAAVLFILTIVLTAVGSTVLATCHAG